jgi:hypothetical protein
MRIKIDTVPLGRKTWLRMRQMREDEELAAQRVWIWDEVWDRWRPPTLALDEF